MGIEPFPYSATQIWNGSYILGDVVGDSLRACNYLIVRKDIDNETSSFSIKTLNIWRKNTTTGAIGTFILL